MRIAAGAGAGSSGALQPRVVVKHLRSPAGEGRAAGPGHSRGGGITYLGGRGSRRAIGRRLTAMAGVATVEGVVPTPSSMAVRRGRETGERVAMRVRARLSIRIRK